MLLFVNVPRMLLFWETDRVFETPLAPTSANRIKRWLELHAPSYQTQSVRCNLSFSTQSHTPPSVFNTSELSSVYFCVNICFTLPWETQRWLWSLLILPITRLLSINSTKSKTLRALLA